MTMGPTSSRDIQSQKSSTKQQQKFQQKSPQTEKYLSPTNIDQQQQQPSPTTTMKTSTAQAKPSVTLARGTKRKQMLAANGSPSPNRSSKSMSTTPTKGSFGWHPLQPIRPSPHLRQQRRIYHRHFTIPPFCPG